MIFRRPHDLLAMTICFSVVTAASATQTVFLDFDTFTEPGEHVYSPPERMAILDELAEIYSPFAIDFTLTDPGAFLASRILFNTDAFGSAESIDFLNLDDDDTAKVNGPGVLSLFDGMVHPDGRPVSIDPLTGEYPVDMIVRASAVTAAHELGHLLGLRHHDGFGPIGTGISVAPTSYTPSYPGPAAAPFTSNHIMGMNSSVALSPENLFGELWLGQRSAIKLAFNEGGGALTMEDDGDHNFLPLTQTMDLGEVIVPNTLHPPEPGAVDGPAYSVDVGVLFGSLEESEFVPGTTETDYYSFSAVEGQLATVEVISHVMRSTEGGRIDDWIDPAVYLLDGTTFLPLGYESSPDAFNDDQFESLDAILFDVEIPYTGDFVLEVGSGAGMGLDTGDYELLVYLFTRTESICDFDDNATCDVDDLDLLLAVGPIDGGVAVDPASALFDLNGDLVIDLVDRDLWLEAAGTVNGFDAAYLLGDANLDGAVNGADYIIWNSSKFTTGTAWSRGDFNGDGVINGADFLIWNANKFTAIGDSLLSVPEPTSSCAIWIVGLGLLLRSRCHG